MIIDKSLNHYGKIYHLFIDPLLNEARSNIVGLIPENSSVFDAGCGTGRLSLMLKKKKNCRVVGADLSLQMINFAKKLNVYSDVEFLHMDLENITVFGENHFDYSIMCQVIHELRPDKQMNVLNEIKRISRKTIILDSNTPLPKNLVGFVIRMIDATIGRDHYYNFKSYISTDGIIGILDRAGLASRITQRIVFKSNCQQIVVLS
ncbi:class I SAM-dependent methyltransferase [candidate division WOR-3 bacterium]|nr:class I SAM-dependent methyltransferase [candidate division WOR-3 bacterium]